MSASGTGGAGRPSPQPEVFCYSLSELWGTQGAATAASRFDATLLRLWDARREAGVFRYALGAPPLTRRLAGPLGILVQLNPERAALRRAAQPVQRLDQPFQPELFNFTRVPPAEVLLEMRRVEAAGEGVAAGEEVAAREEVAAGEDRVRVPAGSLADLVLINASPLEHGHVLLVPAPDLRLPQVLTAHAARLGLDALLLSARPGLRVGFNSLCALASVNHLHLHAYYLERALLAETVPAALEGGPGGPLYTLGPPSHPARGFLLYEEVAARMDAGLLARRTHALASHLARRGYAHNVFMCRGARPVSPALTDGGNDNNGGDGGRVMPSGVRVLVWPREPCPGAKVLWPQDGEDGDAARFNVALCELAGHVLLASRRHFETMTEAQAAAVIGGCSLAERPFRVLAAEVAALLRGDGTGTGDNDGAVCGASNGDSATHGTIDGESGACDASDRQSTAPSSSDIDWASRGC